MDNCYNINEGRDDEISFMYDTWLDIYERDKWVRMHPYDLLEFLTESNFLEKMGFKLEKIEKE